MKQNLTVFSYFCHIYLLSQIKLLILSDFHTTIYNFADPLKSGTLKHYIWSQQLMVCVYNYRTVVQKNIFFPGQIIEFVKQMNDLELHIVIWQEKISIFIMRRIYEQNSILIANYLVESSFRVDTGHFFRTSPPQCLIFLGIPYFRE